MTHNLVFVLGYEIMCRMLYIICHIIYLVSDIFMLLFFYLCYPCDNKYNIHAVCYCIDGAYYCSNLPVYIVSADAQCGCFHQQYYPYPYPHTGDYCCCAQHNQVVYYIDYADSWCHPGYIGWSHHSSIMLNVSKFVSTIDYIDELSAL